MNTLEKLQTVITLDNAFAWRRETEKTVFCADLLAQADISFNVTRVEVLEALLEQTLENHDRMLGNL
jgi:hypothetical protein